MPKTWRLEDNESPPGSPDTAVGMDDLEMQSGRVHETKTEFGSFGGSFGTSSYALLEGQFPRKSDVERLVAHPHGEAPEPPAHYSHRAPQLRAMVLGANDGLVGTASLMLGVSGGHGGLAVAVLAGLSGLFAGAASMAVGGLSLTADSLINSWI